MYGKSMDIEKRVIEITSQQLNLESKKVTPENHLVQDLKADSLDLVEIVMSLEESFNLQIPDEEAEKFSKLKDLIEYIKKNKN